MPLPTLPALIVAIPLGLALSLGAAQAQTKTKVLPEDACHAQPNTGAVNDCLSKAYAELDVELNAAYKTGFKFIKAAVLQPNLSKDWKRAYQETQRKWIAYREADCGPPVIYEWSGGSGAGAMQLGCRIARTRERLEVLKRRYSRDQ